MMAAELVGHGIYYPAEAARFLHLAPSRLRRWVKGYSYRRHEARSDTLRHRPSVLKTRMRRASSPPGGAVTFLELMELRAVRELVITHGFPLQTVRRMAALLQAEFHTPYPFASRAVFVEGSRLFASLTQEDREHIIEVSPGRTAQVQWSTIFRPVLREVEFDSETRLAKLWRPMGADSAVILNPRISFGAPTIEGTRVKTAQLAGMAAVDKPETVAWAFGVPLKAVQSAVAFEESLAARA